MKPTLSLMFFWSIAIVSLPACAAPDSNDSTHVQRYALPQRGSLELKVPSHWRARVSQPDKQAPPTINFAPRKGKPFVINLTPAWQTAESKLPADKEALRKRVEHDADGIRLFAVEKDLKLIELNGTSGSGFYFSATDRALQAGGYKLMNKGGIVVNDLIVSFNILTNDGQERVVRDALAMLQSAIHVPAQASTQPNGTTRAKP